MERPELFLLILKRLNEHKISYVVTGSVAAIVYGEPRLTNDIDLLLMIQESEINKFLSAFPLDSFYIPPEDIIKVEVKRSERGHFNIIHHNSGFKADLYFVGSDGLQLWAIKNKREIIFQDEKIYLAPPEYVILKKLEFYKEGQSLKHIEDIKGIIFHSKDNINFEFLTENARKKGLQELLNSVLVNLDIINKT